MNTLEIKLGKKIIYAFYAMLILTVFNWFNGCSANRENNKLKKEITVLKNTLDSTNRVLPKIIKDITEQTSYEFLIYEDDLDRGKTSLSDIKNKIKD